MAHLIHTAAHTVHRNLLSNQHLLCHFFLDPNGPYAHIGALPPNSKHKPKGKIFAALILIVVVVAVITLVISNASKNNTNSADTLFQTALANSLATHSYSQKEVIGQDNIQLRQDVSDVTMPRQSGTVDLVSVGTKLEGYSSIANSYLRYTQFPDTTSASPDTILNKWQQVRKNGVLPASYKDTDSLKDLFDARTSIMGTYITGNFSQNDQQTLLNFIKAKGVYSYDPNAASAENSDGDSVMGYDVTISADGLKELNQKVGSMMHLSQTDIDAAIARINPDIVAKDTLKIDISTTTHRLVKVTTTSASVPSVITYSNFNAAVVSTEPTADFQYNDFQALLTGQSASLPVTEKNSN